MDAAESTMESLLAATIRTSSELFLVGHEYGHIIDGHLGRGRNVAAVVGDEEVTEVHNSQADELEADARGLTLSIQAMRWYAWFLPQAMFGPALFLKSAELIRKVGAVLEGGSSEVPYAEHESHPPPLVRIGALSDAITTDFPGSGLPNELVNASEQWMLLPLLILDLLFEQIEPFWLSFGICVRRLGSVR